MREEDTHIGTGFRSSFLTAVSFTTKKKKTSLDALPSVLRPRSLKLRPVSHQRSQTQSAFMFASRDNRGRKRKREYKRDADHQHNMNVR